MIIKYYKLVQLKFTIFKWKIELEVWSKTFWNNYDNKVAA